MSLWGLRDNVPEAGPSTLRLTSSESPQKKRPRSSDPLNGRKQQQQHKKAKPAPFANGPAVAHTHANGGTSSSSAQSSPSARSHPLPTTSNKAGPSSSSSGPPNKLLSIRQRLPIWSSRERIVDEIRSNETTILVADTGSGKSTQVPQFLHSCADGYFTSGHKLVGITQPRRMAAISLSKRVALEMAHTDGEASPLVGYAIRFQDKTTRRTRIKFMTDGWLLREFVRGAAQLVAEGKDIDDVHDAGHAGLLPQYSCLIIDEAHERTVRTDLLLGLAKRVQRKRRELRREWEQRGKKEGKEPQLLHIVVMSATLDADLFSRFFASEEGKPAPVLYVQGRTHEVTVNHLIEAEPDWLDAAKRQVLQLHVSRPLPGDILVFGTGAEEIESLCSSFRHLSNHLPQWADDRQRATGQKTAVGALHVVPLYAALGNKAVAEVYRPTPVGCRKVVVATNIAETSVTIPGVRYVVDCGLAKEKMHVSASGIASIAAANRNPASKQAHQQQQGIETLTTRAISQSAAAQRAGRAGREAAGECYRLYPRVELERMDATTMPEIHRAELSSVALDCFAAGVDPREVDWVDAPREGKLEGAVMELAGLGAVERRGRVKAKGEERNGTTQNGTDDTKEGKLVLTEMGQRMTLLPLPPRFSHLLLTAANTASPAVVRQARDLVAILSSERDIFLEPSAAAVRSSDQDKGKRRPAGKDGEEEDGDLSERLEAKRAEANKARSAFRHWSGDHVTMLRAFYAYLKTKRSTSTFTSSQNGQPNHNGGKSKGKDKAASAAALQEVKTWCNAHYLSLRALREIEEIRDQIDGICRKAGILARDESKDETAVNGSAQGRKDLGGCSDSSDEEGVDAEEDSDDSDAPLRVIKCSDRAKIQEEDDFTSNLLDDANEDYASLRKCLVTGRSTSHLAMRLGGDSSSSSGNAPPGQAGSYRVLCGPEVFKLHPASSLHPQRSAGVSGGVSLPRMLVFEELMYTSQLFVRCASAIDVEWVREGMMKGDGGM